MWDHLYIALVLTRLYFCLCPSYLHPDEAFQGPEPVAGYVFQHVTKLSWEFTAIYPIRSFFALWPVYGAPMTLLKWLAEASDSNAANPTVAFRFLRLTMLAMSVGLEDGAIRILLDSPRQRRTTLLLVASSYVTWTWQVHTFSNSVETVLLCWALVFMKRIREDGQSDPDVLAYALLGFIAVFGTFNRITFPGFLAVPFCFVMPNMLKRPVAMGIFVLSSLITLVIGICIDSYVYNSEPHSLLVNLRRPVLTPLNNLLYNSRASNLVDHGVHPYYQHFFINMPQLLGPAYIWLMNRPSFGVELASAFGGIFLLSLFPHQEARFCLPAVPLVLASVRVPEKFRKTWLVLWILFNTALGLLMGMYHQAGVVPAQIFLGKQTNISEAFWWKTYSPPTWLLNGKNGNLSTIDLMGQNQDSVQETICSSIGGHDGVNRVLVAPYSAMFLDQFVNAKHVSGTTQMALTELWSTRTHLNLDDMDFAEDGVVQTLWRVVGRRGLVIWNVECISRYPNIAAGVHRDW